MTDTDHLANAIHATTLIDQGGDEDETNTLALIAIANALTAIAQTMANNATPPDVTITDTGPMATLGRLVLANGQLLGSTNAIDHDGHTDVTLTIAVDLHLAHVHGDVLRATPSTLADLGWARCIHRRGWGVPPCRRARMTWDPLESTCRHASLSIL